MLNIIRLNFHYRYRLYLTELNNSTRSAVYFYSTSPPIISNHHVCCYYATTCSALHCQIYSAFPRPSFCYCCCFWNWPDRLKCSVIYHACYSAYFSSYLQLSHCPSTILKESLPHYYCDYFDWMVGYNFERIAITVGLTTWL